ncbi:MAG TPA: WYL domain-containing protein [Galbitalea sp.]|jgi:predicted DNA-binding transcriptional regulator YafY
MLETSTRLLALLSLLQLPGGLSGSEIAARLDVSTRTVRNDIGRLRTLGYPVDARRGSTGHYRLGAGASLPPLLLDDEEAVAVAIGLSSAGGVNGIESSSARALAKLEQVLPDRLRRQVRAVHRAVSQAPENLDTNVEDPEVDPAALACVASAIRDRHWLRFDYQDQQVRVEPYRLVNWRRRWYLVARDPVAATWRSFRLDWMRLRMPTHRVFEPTEFPGGDYTAFVLRDVASTGWTVHARFLVFAPADEVLSRINPTVGVVEAVDERTCVLVTGSDSYEVMAVYIGMLGLDFEIREPAELVAHLRELGSRYLNSIA